MQTRTVTNISLQQLSHLPSFAAYILEHKLTAFAELQVALSKEFNLPLLKLFSKLSHEEMVEMGKTSGREFLTYLAQNQAQEQIDNSIKRWMDNQLPSIDKHEVVAEDINLITYIRKRAFLHLIPDYCRDAEQIIELVKEIDLFCMQSEMVSTNAYISMLKQSIGEHSYLIEKVNDTTPGAIYVFDVIDFKGIYSNNKLPDIIGYTQEELNEEQNVIGNLIHPEDAASLIDHAEELMKAPDGAIISYKYRIRTKDGQYKWLRNYESVFRRLNDGTVKQKIGITLDIDKEQGIGEALRQSEKRYKEAEAITHIGNYIWDLKTTELEWSDELFRIYGLEPRAAFPSDLIRVYNHPEDNDHVNQQIQTAIATTGSFDFYYRIIPQEGLQKILHARGEVKRDPDGEPALIIGTAQDVTEKQNLIRELREKEFLYKQAEELANMGNWSWDIHLNKLEWTDQLYRIYGLSPQSEEITIERFLSFVHPDDKERVAVGVEAIEQEALLDYTFRIITADGKTKILRSVAQIQKDASGKAVKVIGTERDITEKQTLIDRLKYSENLYKQAQFLAHVGNWTWNIKDNRIEWSDELYRIYGIEQSEDLTYEKYLSIIHPADREKVTTQVQHSLQTGESWEFTHRLVRSNGETRIVSATGEVLKDKNGEPYMMIGAAQDVTERQLLIEKLQDSEALFKQAQSLAHLGSWTMDIKTGLFTWSDEMFNIYEVDRNEKMDFDKWISLINPAEKEEILAYYDSCIREKKLYDKIHKIYLRNGKVKTIHRKGEFIYDEKGEPVRMIGTTQDITEDHRVQQELKDNQTFIRKITDATPSIIGSYNINTGKYVFISEGLEKLLGYDPKDALEQGAAFFLPLMHPDDLPTIMEKNARALEDANSNPDKNDFVAEFTYRMRHKDGNYRWFHTYGTVFDRNSDNKVEHILNISLDVTDQVEASEKIKQQEHFIKQIADASPTILYLYDVEKQSIAYVNREIFFVLGYLPEEMINAGAGVTELIYHPEDYHLLPGRKESSKTFQQVDSMIQYECRMRNKEGEWRWLLVREIVFNTDDKGNIRQVLGAALDINRRKEMEKTILQNTLLLEQSNASLEEFAYVASHDLKEPLRKISTFGDRLVAMQQDNLAPEGKMYLQKIVDASQRMQTMINDLLAISMITGNTSFEPYSLQKIYEETLQTLEFKIEQQNAIIRADSLPEANIIVSQFRQLFQNLLSNSLKFVRPGVQPEITISHQYLSPHEMVHYQLAEAERYHKIEFADNGIGFENEFAGKIFAIFQRLHGRSEYEGSGIGLAICKKIVEHHGGIIFASGVPDVGASFTIILPA